MRKKSRPVKAREDVRKDGRTVRGSWRNGRRVETAENLVPSRTKAALLPTRSRVGGNGRGFGTAPLRLTNKRW